MNNEVKVSVTITLQGGVMLTHEEAKAREKQGLVSYDNFSMEVSDAKGENKEVIHFQTRKSVPAIQVLNITNEGYNTMIDELIIPYWSKAGYWTSINSKMRLEAHLQKICESLGGIYYTYTVFED